MAAPDPAAPSATARAPLAGRAALCMVALMWSLPFLQPSHYYPLPLFYSEWVAFALGLAALGVALFLPRDTVMEIPRVVVVPLALAGVLYLHLWLNKVPYHEQVSLAALYLVWAAALALLAGRLRLDVGSHTFVTVLAWALLAGGLLNAAAGILQHYDARGVLHWLVTPKLGERVYGNLVQANHFSSHLLMAMASLMFLCARGGIGMAPAVPAALLLMFALALAATLSVWVSLALLLALAGVLYARQRGAEHRRLLILAAALLPAYMAMQALVQLPWLAASSATVTSVERLFGEITSGQIRLTLWREAWGMFLQSPLTGVGFGQHAWHSYLLAATREGVALTEVYNHAHNIVMHLLAETGMLGAGVVVTGMLAWLWALRHAAFDLNRWWALALLAVLGVHSMLEYPLWYGYFLGIVAVVLGAFDARRFVLRKAGLIRAAMAGVVILGWVNAAVLLVHYRAMEKWMISVSREIPREEMVRANRALLAVHDSLLAPYVELAFARALGYDSNDLRRKLDFSSRVVRYIPSSFVAYQHAVLLALAGDPEAPVFLERSVKAYPDKFLLFQRELEALTEKDRSAIAPFLEKVRQHAIHLGHAAKPAP